MNGSLRERRDRIYLTGFMGSGKSTIGPILANTIGYDFVDIDRLIETRENRSVRSIFLESGEQYFRTLERAVIGELQSRARLVISLGGGTVTDPETFQAIVASGILVYLKVTPDQLYNRLHRRTDRPLLSDDQGNLLSEAALRERIKTLYEAREPVYARADIVVPTDDRRVGITVDAIVRRLSRHLR